MTVRGKPILPLSLDQQVSLLLYSRCLLPFIYVYVCVAAYVLVLVCGGQKRARDLLKLECQLLMRVLQAELQSSGRAESALNCCKFRDFMDKSMILS